MKKVAVILSILSALCGPTYAGPETFSAREMKQVAPPAPPTCPDWSGFYIGGFGGYKFVNSGINLNLFGEWNVPDVAPPAFIRDLEEIGSKDLDLSGPEAGGFIGYNMQFNKWVVGLEGSGAYLWSDDSHDFNHFRGSTISVHTSLESHYLFTAGPRLGYAVCRFLPYLTGGVAVGQIDLHQQIVLPGLVDQRGNLDDAQVGWMVGGGLQYAITDHWSARAQYQYVDLMCDDISSVAFPQRSTTGLFRSHHEVCLTEHNVSFALIYRF
jgi:outer membrane immunogenic protein